MKHFPHLDARRLEALLRRHRPGRRRRGRSIRWPGSVTGLHATYAVAARDGSEVSHREYMAALNEVLKTTRPAVAS